MEVKTELKYTLLTTIGIVLLIIVLPAGILFMICLFVYRHFSSKPAEIGQGKEYPDATKALNSKEYQKIQETMR